MATIRDEERERIENKHGVKCVICACPPNEMIDENSTEVPLYAIDQDDSNISPENMVPMCSSCVWHCVHVDKAPYQFYHRQIPLYKRKIVDSAYTGPQLSHRDALEYVYEKESDIVMPESVTDELGDADWVFDTDTYPKYYHEARERLATKE